MDYDAIVIGSGFGGSVAALRLSEKGYRVAVLEMGRRISREDIIAANKSAKDLFWVPALGMKGFFTQRFYKHVTMVGGIGVGGGSLVYAAVLLEPKDFFYQDSSWSQMGIDWKSEIKPHLKLASQMLGVTTCPVSGLQDEYLALTAKKLGAGETHGPVPLGIYFGPDDKETPDPYFNGQGPPRVGCSSSGNCLAGCEQGAKNSLDLNYLYLAEKNGVKILPLHKAYLIRPIAGGYEVEIKHPLDSKHTHSPLKAKKIVLAAGVVGTLELLFRSREAGLLPHLSPRLGQQVRTNSEAIVGAISKDIHMDLSKGPAISSDFYPNEYTHITQNRIPPSYKIMRSYSGPLVDDQNVVRRAFKALLQYLRHILVAELSIRAGVNWHKRTTWLTVMQSLDNQMAFTWGKGAFSGFKPGLQSKTPSGKSVPTYIPEANQAARAYAEVSNGIPYNSLMETVLNMSATAHILGGCAIGANPEVGVIDSQHEVFGYPGMYVVDGAAIPANVGVNPSLTITAMAERAMSLVERNA